MLIGMLYMTQGAQLLYHLQPKGGSNGNRNIHPFRCRSNGAPGFVCKPCSGSGVWAEFADGLRGRILWRQRYLSFGCHDDYSGRKGSSGRDPCDHSRTGGCRQPGAAAWLKTLPYKRKLEPSAGKYRLSRRLTSHPYPARSQVVRQERRTQRVLLLRVITGGCHLSRMNIPQAPVQFATVSGDRLAMLATARRNRLG